MKPRIVLIGHFYAFALKLAGVSRYAQARGWDVDTIDWDEARTGSPKALRSRPLRVHDLPQWLPRKLGIREGTACGYPLVVSTMPIPGVANVRVLGEGTEGTTITANDLAAMRKAFAAEIAAMKLR